MSADLDAVVVGAGVVGLAIARSLTARGREVVVLEQHRQIGAETSSRNSEVIHAGLYYQPGSLRAKLCVAGKELLYEFCAQNGVSHNRCGKLLVATAQDELPKLRAIAKQAAANGVSDLQPLGRVEALALEPELNCLAACLSPSTGVVDSHGLMAALEGHITSGGGQLVLGTIVTGISLNAAGHFKITADSQGSLSTITCTTLILSAGLGASRIGAMIDYGESSYQPPATYPAKGHYFTLSGKAPFSRLIYPMPSGAWLGVHQSLDHAGQTKFGPDIYWLADPDAPLDYGFEDEPARRQTFAREIRRYYPGLDADNLHPGYTGIRPKIYSQGEPVPDFAIHGREAHGINGIDGIGGLIALYGIESPGLTSCLAIGEYVAEQL